jgi:hypothetical protein
MLPRFRIAAAILPILCPFCLPNAGAQTPVALPYTMTTLAGISPAPATSGAACSAGSAFTTTDSYGDGCPAANAYLQWQTGGNYSGAEVDAYGNVFVDDDKTGVLHMINSATGLVTLAAGGNTACSSRVDSSGDGCVAATGTAAGAISGSRGLGIDPYGNLVVAGYSDHLIHMICRSASPLCGSGTPSPANPILIAIGNMGLVAGCAYSSGSSGVTGKGLDNTPGFSTGSNAVPAFANGGGSSSKCTTSYGEVNAPRGATADGYGNVYYADTASARWRVVLGPQSYHGVSNPLWAVLEQNPSWYNGTTLFLTAGYVYTIAGISTTPTSAGSSSNCGGNPSYPTPWRRTAMETDACLPAVPSS